MITESQIFKHMEKFTNEVPRYKSISLGDVYQFFNSNGKGWPLHRVTWDNEWFEQLYERLESYYDDKLRAQNMDFMYHMDMLMEEDKKRQKTMTV